MTAPGLRARPRSGQAPLGGLAATAVTSATRWPTPHPAIQLVPALMRGMLWPERRSHRPEVGVLHHLPDSEFVIE